MSTPPRPTTDADAALVVAGLHKRFGSTVAVDHMDLVVPRGSLTALLGPSGCGKTTALRTVAGLLSPDGGSITIDGRTVAGPGVHVPPERRRVGMVFQDYALFPHLTVAKNVAYGLTGLSRAQRRRRVAEVLDLVGLGAYGSRLPVALSGGQQQRVALARALAPEPQLILLDEPFSNLDAALRAVVREDVRAILRAADATALFVTHDQEEALSLADRVVVMDQGRVHQVADPQTLYTQPATRFVAEFVGEADVLAGTRADRFLVDTALGRLATDRPLESATAAVVIRPEALRLVRDDAGVGVVTAISYFGHDQLVQVRLPDGLLLRARRGPALDLQRGDTVHVHVDGPVVVFDDAPTATRTLAPA
ncbi:ABC transporter ATP-binding protein [Egicoccus sp. AB-alg2]|uniref:ABC transporter ATP-binding protein n=1 Tax=Egicoccus sp. AB-alg2 TaxID=3242693 RepID=UPI00359E9D5D